MAALPPTLFLTVGLPGTGKTTRAIALAAEHGILRLTPDDWMAPLFGESDAGGRRDVLEGRFLWVAHELLRGGSSVVVDFGCWSAEERYAIRSLAERAGGRFAMEYAVVSEPERLARCARRWLEHPETTFEMTDEDQARYVDLFQPPSPDELALGPLPAPPDGVTTWSRWASERWPSLPDLG